MTVPSNKLYIRNAASLISQRELDAIKEKQDKIEKSFKKYAHAKANSMAPGLNWAQPDPETLKTGVEEFAKKHPKNYYLLIRNARRALEADDWEAVKAPCLELIKLFPQQTGGQSNAYVMLARAHRELKEHDAERKTLEIFASMSDDAYPVFQRLAELAVENKDWVTEDTDKMFYQIEDKED